MLQRLKKSLKLLCGLFRTAVSLFRASVKQEELTKSLKNVASIENRIYREELKESLGMNFFSPFSLKGSSKCTNHVNVHKLYAVVFPRLFISISKFLKLLNKLYNELEVNKNII